MPALAALPDLPDDAWTAIPEAGRVARAHGADRIGVRHLWYGALSVDKSRAVQRRSMQGSPPLIALRRRRHFQGLVQGARAKNTTDAPIINRATPTPVQ